jgi:hypothetical protein
MDRGAAAVVGVDALRQIALVVMAVVQRARSDSRGLMWPASDGQPTVQPATGITRCGSFSMSLTVCE